MPPYDKDRHIKRVNNMLDEVARQLEKRRVKRGNKGGSSGTKQEAKKKANFFHRTKADASDPGKNENS